MSFWNLVKICAKHQHNFSKKPDVKIVFPGDSQVENENFGNSFDNCSEIMKVELQVHEAMLERWNLTANVFYHALNVMGKEFERKMFSNIFDKYFFWSSSFGTLLKPCMLGMSAIQLWYSCLRFLLLQQTVSDVSERYTKFLEVSLTTELL